MERKSSDSVRVSSFRGANGEYTVTTCWRLAGAFIKRRAFFSQVGALEQKCSADKSRAIGRAQMSALERDAHRLARSMQARIRGLQRTAHRARDLRHAEPFDLVQHDDHSFLVVEPGKKCFDL